MPRSSTGHVVPPNSRQPSWAIRFRAYGKRRYVTLGTPEDGWNRARAEEELANALADVRRGIWKPPHPAAPGPGGADQPTFHQFASEWIESRSGEFSTRTIEDYKLALSHHLLPFFAEHRLSEI